MASFGRKSRSRRSASERSDSDTHSVPPPPLPPKEPVIVIDDDEEEEEEEEELRVQARNRERPRQSSEQTLLSSDDDRTVKSLESDDSIEFREKLEAESSESSIKFMSEEEKREEEEEECGSKSSSESSVKLVEDRSFMATSAPKVKVNEKEVDEVYHRRITKLGPDFCVARRTRTQVGKQDRVSYAEYFKGKLSDDSEYVEEEEEEDEATEPENVEAEKSDSMSLRGESGEGGSTEVYRKKRKLGIDILVSLSNKRANSEGGASSGSVGVSQRTRSRFNSMPYVKTKKMGTVSNPFCLDADELEDEENAVEDDDNWVEVYGKKRKGVWNGGEGCSRMDAKVHGCGNVTGMDVDGREEAEPEEVRTHKSKNRKRVRPPKAEELFKILTETIWNNAKKHPEKLVNEKSPSVGGNASCQENMLPLIFSFGDDDPKPVVKSEHEKELDELWLDFDLATKAENIGQYRDDEVISKFYG